MNMVQIEQHVWGMTPEGEAIVLYTLRNDRGAEVRLSNYGAAIVSVTMPDREGRMADVVLGYRHPEGYFHDGAASGKSVGRCANRIGGAAFTLNGTTYHLTANEGKNQLHGGKVGFHKKLWRFTCAPGAVTFLLDSPDGEEGFPGNLHVEVTMPWRGTL